MTVGFDNIERKDTVTVRDRETTEQKIVKISELSKTLFELYQEVS